MKFDFNKLQNKLRKSLNRRWDKGDVPITPATPRVTNESIAESREEVLGKARKLIYPLRHSRTRLVKWSIGLVIAVVVLFLATSALALYKFQSTSAFMYGVTRIIPYPVAYADGRLVSYHDYLFELRHFMHYYQAQQGINFAGNDGQRQLNELKTRSLKQVINRAYVAKLADQHDISVTDEQVDRQVKIAREENRLGANDEVFRSVLNDFWGWSLEDFKHELSLELRDQKVAAALDDNTTQQAKSVYEQLRDGADFAKLAAQVSQDKQTASSGGEYNFSITRDNHDLPPIVVQTIFSLKEGGYSKVIDTGYTLEIIKVLSVDGDKRHAAHIALNYQDINHFTDPLKKEHPPTQFIYFN